MPRCREAGHKDELSRYRPEYRLAIDNAVRRAVAMTFSESDRLGKAAELADKELETGNYVLH